MYIQTMFSKLTRMNYLYLTLIGILWSVQLFSQTNKNIFDKFESQIIKIDGYNINVESLGNGKAIFFFAGGPGNSHDYMQGSFGQYYSTHQVVFIDMLGRGISDDAKDVGEYSLGNDVHITEEVRRALKLDKISLVGHSYGSMIAQAYAIKYTDKVEKMVLINGFHSGEMWQANCDSYNHYIRTHFPEYWKQIDSLRVLGYVSSDSIFSKLYASIPTKFIYYHDTKLKQNVPPKKYRDWNSDVYFVIIGRDADFYVSKSMMDVDFRRELKDLKIPTLVIAGRYDGVSTPEYALQYKKIMPGAKFVMFEQSGHNPYIEEPEKFYALFDDFFGIKR